MSDITIEITDLTQKYLKNNCTNLDKLDLANLLTVYLTHEIAEKILPLLKQLVHKIFEQHYDDYVDSLIDLYFVMKHPELLKYALSFIDKVDVIKYIMEFEDGDGPETLKSIADFVYKHKLKLPKEIIERHFSQKKVINKEYGNGKINMDMDMKK